MDAARWTVTLAGAALIALVNYWFFGRSRPRA
jgi:plastocyanin domain-containing protein